MKLMEDYNKEMASYEGAVYLEIKEGYGAHGYFEAVQSHDGSIVVGCFFNDAVTPLDTSDLKVTAVDKDGWSIWMEGQVVMPSWNMRTVHETNISTTVIKPSKMRAMRMPEKELKYLGSRFSLSNLMFDHYSEELPVPINLTIEDREINILPCNRYAECERELRANGGIMVTALVSIKGSNDARHSLDEDAEFMDSLVLALRLWTGNKLDWLCGEGLDDRLDTTVERLHKNGIVGSYSNTLTALGFQTNLNELMQAWFERKAEILSAKTIGKFINYFVDCCSTGPYLEIRALSAATLLDALSLEYVSALGAVDILPEATFCVGVLPKLEEAVDSIELDPGIKDQLKGNLSGLYRKSFRWRLKLLNEKLYLQMDSKLINRVKNARDKLVHEGGFRNSGTKDKYSSYACLLWTDLVAVFRLIGYSGELPHLADTLGRFGSKYDRAE